MLDKLSGDQRMILMKFVCSFAWADLHIQDEERSFVAKLVRKLKLDPDEKKQVDGWLEVPPTPDEVDPNRIPRAHRELFLKTMREVVHADSHVDPEEEENLLLFEQLIP